MKQLIIAALLATSGTAFAGGQEGSIGVGAESSLSGTGGLSLNYDAGKFHVGGFLSFRDTAGNNNHYVAFGGRFFYHAHSTAMSDLGIGLGLGVGNRPDPIMGGPNDDPDHRATDVFIEPSAQIRVFVASNVALSFTAGIVIGTLDADGVAFGGQGIGNAGTYALLPTATAGIHYYFF